MSYICHLNILKTTRWPAYTQLSSSLSPYLSLLLYFLDSSYECPIHVFDGLILDPSLLLLFLLLPELHHLSTRLGLHVGETQLDLLYVMHREVAWVRAEGLDQGGQGQGVGGQQE